MLVYGDSRRSESPTTLIESLGNQVRRRPGGAANRREWGTTLLIEAGELVQGIFDACEDGRAARPLDPLCRDVVLAAARLYLGTQHDAGHEDGSLPRSTHALTKALATLARCSLPAEVEIRTPEGYAYYAVYPILYARAAEQLKSRHRPWVVIGIRSIGTSLGAVVAATLRTEHLHFVRPAGPPFCRALPIDANVDQFLANGGDTNYAIVDEGPGLSGSSFGAVADCLESHGISFDRIHFFPSHGGELGPKASDTHRARWHRAHRCHSDFESYFDQARLRATIFDERRGEICDISAGRWRAELYPDVNAWPPVHPGLERRKYLLRADSSSRVAKFVGLGAYGRAQVKRAFELYERNLIPEPLGYRDGFLVSTWHAEAIPLDRASIARSDYFDSVMRYLAFVGSTCRAPCAGASPDELLTMASSNVGEALGYEAAARIGRRFGGSVRHVAEVSRPVSIDGRMHPWEWLVLPSGLLLKADALEHCSDHGLVGCQDLAWDLAGLRIEHGTTPSECAWLSSALVDAGAYRADEEKERFFSICYIAYQLGYYGLAAEAAGALDASESERCTARRNFYAQHLVELLRSF